MHMRGICKAYAGEHGNTLKKPADMTTVRFRGHGATISAGRRAFFTPQLQASSMYISLPLALLNTSRSMAISGT